MSDVNLKHEIMGSIIRVARKNRCVIDGKLSELGIHHSQHVLLMYLSCRHEMPSQSEIAAQLDVSPAAVAGTIKKLEQGGYIEKNTDKDDGRYHAIGMTEKGRKIVERSRQLFAEADQESFHDISEDELEQMYSVLEKVWINLKKLEQRQGKDELD